MRRRAAAALVATLLGCSGGAARSPAPAPAPVLAPAQVAAAASVRAVLTRYHQRGAFAGVAVVRAGGVELVADGFARGAEPSPSADELARWASISKQVVATLVMRAVAAGRLDLDAPAARYLPALRATRVTVRDLLRHTSGLPDPDAATPDGEVSPMWRREAGPGTPSTAEVLATCDRPDAVPGAGFHYDNCDTLVLAEVLARTEGAPLARLIARDLTGPLGLTTVRLADGDDDAAHPHWLDPRTPEPPLRLARYGGAGALLGSGRDLARWGQALIDHRVLDAASTTTMFTGDPALGFVALGSWAYPLTIAGHTVLVVERQGAIGGARSALLLVPDRDLVIAVWSAHGDVTLEGTWSGQGLLADLLAALLTG